MRVPRKNGEAVIVLGGKSGAFVFGFWSMAGAICGASTVWGAVRLFGYAVEAPRAWWGA
jgi:hypothetical protein